MHCISKKKQRLHRRLGETYMLVLEGLLGGEGVALALCVGTETVVAVVLGSTH